MQDETKLNVVEHNCECEYPKIITENDNISNILECWALMKPCTLTYGSNQVEFLIGNKNFKAIIEDESFLNIEKTKHSKKILSEYNILPKTYFKLRLKISNKINKNTKEIVVSSAEYKILKVLEIYNY